MKFIRNIAFTAIASFAVFSMVTYTACNKDACKDVTCNNGGTCINGTCACPDGYEGTNCETITREKFLGTWKGSDVCNNNTYNVTLTVSSSSDEVRALVNNPGGFGNSITITGRVSGTNKLTFSDQSAGGTGRILNGTMTFNGSSMTFDYTVTDAVGGSDNCAGNYAKQ
ncbi:MAG: calcium-binding EGF-like domain-containing protein [Chitinophagales bacterium]|nr:calcium-binding EGF-like domain-containing protein [Chitinophagales bacterium]